MKRVYLVSVYLLAIDEFQAQLKPFPVGTVNGQLTEQFPDQPACDGAHPAVSLGDLLDTVRLAAEPLYALQPFQLPPVALTDGNTFPTGCLMAESDNLVQ